jgi:hypothetical protein
LIYVGVAISIHFLPFAATSDTTFSKKHPTSFDFSSFRSLSATFKFSSGAELRVFVAQCAHDSHFAPGQVDKSMHFHVALGMTQIDHEYQESTINPNKSTIFPALIHHKSQNNSLQDGAPKIAKLVYKWLNNGLW